MHFSPVSRDVEGTAEIAGCMSAAGLVIILATCLSIYGTTSFQRKEIVGIKTLSGRYKLMLKHVSSTFK